MEDRKKTQQEEQQNMEMQNDHIKPTKEFVSPESLYEELIAGVRRYHPSTDISLIEKAYKIADEAHKGQVRKSGRLISFIPCAWRLFLRNWNWIKRPLWQGFCMMWWKTL